jgi:hypothetical protein
MQQQHEYLITGTHTETGEPVSFRLEATDQNDAAAQAHNRGVKVERVAYIQPAPLNQEGKNFTAGSELIQLGLILVLLALTSAFLGNFSGSDARLLTFALAAIVNLIGGLLLLAGVIRWAVQPLVFKLDEVREQITRRDDHAS